jgi:hypothetical protein
MGKQAGRAHYCFEAYGDSEMRKATYSFYARIDQETDQRRRRLQELLGCSASELVEKAFRKLESCADSPSQQASNAA